MQNNEEILDNIRDHPHKLGYLINKNKLTEIHSYWIKYLWYPIEYFIKDNKKNLLDMLNFFNSLGKCYEIKNEKNQLERHPLTEEILLELLSNPKRSLQAHRGSYKTTALSTIGVLLRLLFEPNIRICLVQKNFTKASLLLQTIRQAMQVPEIKELFKIAHNGLTPKATTKRDNILTFNFKKTYTPEGNVNAYGVIQDMTGKHFDFIQADDFVTMDDKVSKAEREKTKLRLEDIMNNVIDPGKQMGLSGTPWHKEDAWNICPNTLKFDIYMLNILTEKEKEEKRRDLTPVSFAANHELRHIASDSQMFQDAHWQKWDVFIKTGVYGHLDAKYSGSHTNGLCFMAKKKDGRIQAVGFCFHEHIDDKLDFVVEKWKKYFCGTLYLEDNADKGYLAKELQKKGIKVETYHENMNKHIKIETYGYKHWDNIDWDIDTDPEYISQILDYQEGQEPDDCADNFSSLCRQKFDKPIVDMSRWKWN